ncbi:MAG: SDR family NAD(P)-dependent oxidoreductase [Oceanospirillaceae bacterium]
MNDISSVGNKASIHRKTVLITGSTDGVGRKLALRGARVLIHGRSADKIRSTVESIKQITSNNNIYGYQADLSFLVQTRQLAERVLFEHPTLDILINNAGVGPSNSEDQLKRVVSEDGYELRFQVNYLATAMLCQLLLPALKLVKGRIINIASAAQLPLQFDDLMMEKKFNSSSAYAQSKLAVIMFSLLFAKKIRDQGVTVNALDPGSFLNTRMVQQAYGVTGSNPESGAITQLFLACAPELDGVTMQYFSQLRPAKANEQAYDLIAQQRLWDITNQLLYIASTK